MKIKAIQYYREENASTSKRQRSSLTVTAFGCERRAFIDARSRTGAVQVGRLRPLRSPMGSLGTTHGRWRPMAAGTDVERPFRCLRRVEQKGSEETTHMKAIVV